MLNPETALYCCEQIRACEKLALTQYHLDEQELMARAGLAAFTQLQCLYPGVTCIAVFCGAGNNAGDGYVLARLAHEAGLSVIVYQCKTISDLPPTAQYAAFSALDAGVDCQPFDEPLDSEVEVIVDALLGIGLKGPVHGNMALAIDQINASDLPVLSLDVPSGLNADSGCVASIAVKAEHTVTFIALKTGFYTADGPDYCGLVHCCSLQLEACIAKQKPSAFLSTTLAPLKSRLNNSHKGDYGHVLVVGGGTGMPGAVLLAAKAALRTGAGAVTVATWPSHVPGIFSALPEAMVVGVESVALLEPFLERATVCVLGPGLGESSWAKALFAHSINAPLPLVVDASALRLLAKAPQRDDHWILTPHPGEAAALLACKTTSVQDNRYEASAEIQRRYGGVVVLKGAGTVVQSGTDEAWVCARGNPAMASAGMGDVLSGIIAGLCAQGLSLTESARQGVYAHALAGDKIVQQMGGAGMLASDLINVLPDVFHDKK